MREAGRVRMSAIARCGWLTRAPRYSHPPPSLLSVQWIEGLGLTNATLEEAEMMVQQECDRLPKQYQVRTIGAGETGGSIYLDVLLCEPAPRL